MGFLFDFASFCTLLLIHTTLQGLAIPGFRILPLPLVEGSVAPLLEGPRRRHLGVVPNHRAPELCRLAIPGWGPTNHRSWGHFLVTPGFVLIH